MDVRLDAVTPRQTVTPIQPVAGATSGRSDNADAPRPDLVTRAALTQTVTNLQERLQSVHRELRFRVDETTGLTVVRVVEAQTGDLIRQIPSQNVLEMHMARELKQGLLLSEQA